jgi:ubiquinone/menaquinone biosynthesis C-methylase UbiE
MADHVCPPWVGYFLLNPLRKLVESPRKLFNPFVREGMVVLEPGCAMGFFTLPLARMVGPAGKVVALDTQPKMLSVLERRARRAGILDLLDIREVGAEGLGIGDLSGKVDFCAVIHVAHEVSDQPAFFADLARAQKPGGRLLIVEPRGHVSTRDFARTLACAEEAGFRPEALPAMYGDRRALLVK